MATALCVSRADQALSSSPSGLDEFRLDGIRLRIFDSIPDGFNVVPVTGNDAGHHLLQRGEVAVYDERWREGICCTGFELTPGLYCYERQRPPPSMTWGMVSNRFRDGDPVTMRIEREVVMVFPHPRRPEHWAWRQLRTRMHQGVRVSARTEGPMHRAGILEHLLGPVVGIYHPGMIGSAN